MSFKNDLKKRIDILISIPSQGMWVEEFGMSLTMMMVASCQHRIEGYKQQMVHVNSVKGSVLPKSRYIAVKEALDRDMDYLLFIDSDQSFPKHTLHKLLAAKKDVVACNIAVKRVPSSPTARMNNGTPHGELVYTDLDSTGLQKVWRVGTGIMLISRKAMLALTPDSFDMRWREDVQHHQGEDWWMCSKWQDTGIEVWIDHDLSKQVGHWGLFNYTHDIVGEVVQLQEKRVA